MFELDIDLLKEQGLQLVDTAKKTAKDLAGKGKVQLELVNQQARLTKAQRQLGALVYSLHKSGEENQPLVDKYIEAVAEVEKAIEDLKAQMTPDEVEETEADAKYVDTEPAEDPETASVEERKLAEEPEAVSVDTEPAEESGVESVEGEPVEEPEPAGDERAEEPEWLEEEIAEEPVAPRGETKICPVCQAEIDADALFCTHCGAQL